MITQMPADYQLSQIVSIYQSEHGTPYLETHQIIGDGKGSQTVGAGKPLTKTTLNALMTAAIGNDALRPTGFIPDNVMAFSQDIAGASNFAFWLSPRQAAMHHSDISAPMLVPYPGLIFIESQGRLTVFALRGNERPTLDTPLFQPPFWNVSHFDGSVCTGNAKKPDRSSSLADRMEAWSNVWFKSLFSHSLNEAYGKTTLGKLWQGLDGKTKFPEKVLLATDKTLRSLLMQHGLI